MTKRFGARQVPGTCSPQPDFHTVFVGHKTTLRPIRILERPLKAPSDKAYGNVAWTLQYEASSRSATCLSIEL
jgi:hypothetical protein